MVRPCHGSDTEREQEQDGDPDVPPEDEELFETPDADAKEEAISKFLDGLEQQERRGFTEIQTYLQRLPVPGSAEIRKMTHAEAIEGQFLPNMSEEEQKRFTPSELLLYKHALEYKWTVEQLKKVIALLIPE